ncbi:hypothetical protein HanIR_Chr11g0542591 [Helianthus annuus]|nr:hypothetical protein HanIR_Chr11g0542591 [Helianthus annuus]
MKILARPDGYYLKKGRHALYQKCSRHKNITGNRNHGFHRIIFRPILDPLENHGPQLPEIYFRV